MDVFSIWKQKKKKPPLNNRLFLALYTLAVSGAYLLSLPFILIFSFQKKYKESLPARFFLWKNRPLPENSIWFHACSFGETRALMSILEAFSKKHPEEKIVFTSTTNTGHAEAKKISSVARYLPFEPLLWFWTKQQKVLVVMEAELWYLLFYAAKRKGARTLLINARISDRSYPKYRRFSWFYRHLFRHVDAVFAQSTTDKERLEALGARNVSVVGNIKLAATARTTREYRKPEGLVVTAASTHDGEEKPIIDAFLDFKKHHPEAKLLIAPRHPDRFGKVADMAERIASDKGVGFSRWSVEKSLKDDIVLIDAMGELVNFYAITDIVILGGAFVPAGGHNPVEVLPFGCKLVSGRHIFNQRAIFSQMEGAIFCDADAIAQALEEATGAPVLHLEKSLSIDPILKEIEYVV